MPDPTVAVPASTTTRWRRHLGDTVRTLGALGPLAVFTAVGPALGAATLAATSERWLPWLEALGGEAAVWLVLATVVLAGLSLVPTHAASLVAGLLFGGLGGSLLALVGVLGAATLGFLVVRRVVGRGFLERLAELPRARVVHAELLGRGPLRAVGILALIRLSPMMPFAATNLLMAACGVSLPAFLVGTALGIAPRVVAVAFAGAGLAQLDLAQGADVRVAVAGLAATVAALAVISALARRALRRATGEAAPTRAVGP